MHRNAGDCTTPNCVFFHDKPKDSELIRDLRKAYVEVLNKHNKLYHFDDSPSEQIEVGTNQPTFSEQECNIVSAVTSALYDEELFEHALKLT